jgi:hypothetical protein
MNSVRRTIVVHGRLAMRERRLAAARERRHGLQIMTFEQLAARLAGGLSRPVDDESLRVAIQATLPSIALGELEGLKALPGMVAAAADTLHKTWRANIDLQARAGEHPRLASIAKLEEAVLATLPAAMMRPSDLVKAALQRIDHVGALFGPIEIVGITELSPCWRPLLRAIATRTSVRWTAGPRSIPAWLEAGFIKVTSTAPRTPEITSVSAATAYHEAIEAIRWARQLIALGKASPEEIGIASVAPADYDDHLLAMRADANLDLHFVHGVKVTASREGQAAAALADILVRGLSQTRVRRLAALLAAYPGPFQELPEGWTRVMPADAPLASPQAWTQLLDRLTAAYWPDGADHNSRLREIISLLSRGVAAAQAVGEALLRGRVLTIWRKALRVAPSGALDLTLETLRQEDGSDPCVSIAWMPASDLAASPRPFVRLLGLNSARWPRGITEDRLLSDHILPTADLDPLPVGVADQRDFATILSTSENQVVLSRARRDSDGRLLGRSTLLHGRPDETYLRRNRVPDHAFSETDRLTARPHEFRALPQAVAASTCWRNWLREEVTPHDGLVRPDHPVIQAILARTQSASSLRCLLRNPLGFVWRYGLNWRAPKAGDDPLVLDPLAMGDLVHLTLDRALGSLEANGGRADASADQISSAVDGAAADVAELWERERAVPPRVIWRRTLEDARELSARGLAYGSEWLPSAHSFSEVAFGGANPKSDAEPPWDPKAGVEIPGAGFRISGYIDRLDISGDRRRAQVRDYKTGEKPKNGIVLDGGKELQRCLYAFSVKAMLGGDLEIEASLLYLRDEVELRLDDPETSLTEIAGYLRAAHANLLSGGGVPGTDTGGTYDDLAFALPANAGAAYCMRKIGAATERLGAAAHVWEAA